MNKSKFDRRLLSLLPAFLMMILIFFFSSQPAEDSSHLSISFSLTLIRFFVHFLRLSVSETNLLLFADSIHAFIRKAAHSTEYACLSLLVFFPFYIYKKIQTKSYLFVILFCFFYACTDELHQLFVPGRACRFLDICIDTFGAILAMSCIFLINNILNKRKTGVH